MAKRSCLTLSENILRSKKVIILRGPTASGKTDLSLELAEKFPIDLISVDSVMVYKGLNIGSAKPSKQILKSYPHHLIDICEPNEKYSAGRFIVDAQKIIRDIQSNDRIPLLVGGTMMYYKVLQDGMSQLPAANEEVRTQIDLKAEKIGWPEMHVELRKVDPESAKEIKPNDKQRIQRAIEVYMITGLAMSELKREGESNNKFDYLSISLLPNDREALYENINNRFDSMIKEGLLDEVSTLLNTERVSNESHSMHSIGYREMLEYIRGEKTLEVAIDTAKLSSRRYAKRQITWLRSFDDQYKLEPMGTDNIKTIEEILNNHFEALD